MREPIWPSWCSCSSRPSSSPTSIRPRLSGRSRRGPGISQSAGAHPPCDDRVVHPGSVVEQRQCRVERGGQLFLAGVPPPVGWIGQCCSEVTSCPAPPRPEREVVACLHDGSRGITKIDEDSDLLPFFVLMSIVIILLCSSITSTKACIFFFFNLTIRITSSSVVIGVLSY